MPGAIGMRDSQLAIPYRELADFCRRWAITELALYGSALRPDFSPDSDLDLLVTYGNDVRWSLLDMVRMEEELSVILGRKVDLVSRRGVEQSPNWIIRREILGSAQVLYAAR